MKMNANISKETFRRVNEAHNSYYDKFHSCKRAWAKGTIFGTLIGAALSFLMSGFQLNDMFFMLLIFQGIAGVMVLTAIFGMQYTKNFGLSCIPRGIMAFGNAGYDIFAGTYVLIGVAYVLIGASVCGWLLGVLLFAFLFPLETLYYWIRYRLEVERVKAMINTRTQDSLYAAAQ